MARSESWLAGGHEMIVHQAFLTEAMVMLFKPRSLEEIPAEGRGACPGVVEVLQQRPIALHLQFTCP